MGVKNKNDIFKSALREHPDFKLNNIGEQSQGGTYRDLVSRNVVFFVTSLFRGVLPVFSALLSWVIYLSLSIIVYLGIDFPIPYVDFNFSELAFYTLILTTLNLIRKAWIEGKRIKALYNKGEWGYLIIIAYLTLVTVLLLLL